MFKITVLLGQNGAGKSSTFSVISGSTAVSSGTVFICKEDLSDNLQLCQRKLGYCPQTNPLFPRLTVREHLRFYAKLKCLGDVANIDKEIDTITKQVLLHQQLDKVSSLHTSHRCPWCATFSLLQSSAVAWNGSCALQWHLLATVELSWYVQ